jgi:hypothetical protein
MIHKRKYITFIATSAALLLMGAMFALPALADPPQNVLVCHWANEHGAQGWGVLDIPENAAINGHVGKHSDKGVSAGGPYFDRIIGVGGFTQGDCDSRNLDSQRTPER